MSHLCIRGLTGVPTMPLHYSCYNIAYLFALLLPLSLRAKAPAMSIFYIIPSFGLYCPAFLLSNPFRTLGFLGPFHSLGILGLFHHSLTLSLPWAFAKSFGLPWPNYYILAFSNSFLWASLTHFLLSFHFLQFSWVYYFILLGFLDSFAFSQATYYFSGPIDHYFCHSGPIVFILLFFFSIFFILLGFFYD